MNTELEILLNLFQQEVDELKSEIDECAKMWYFDDAEILKSVYYQKLQKLNTLKRLQNPKIFDIQLAKRVISLKERALERDQIQYDEEASEELKSRREASLKRSLKRIESEKNKLNSLLSFVPRPVQDDDKVLSLLEDLDNTKIQKLTFEIFPEKVNLEISSDFDHFIIHIYPLEGARMRNFLVRNSLSLLTELDFNVDKMTRRIPRREFFFHEILKILSIIFFDVFGLVGDKEVNVKVLY